MIKDYGSEESQLLEGEEWEIEGSFRILKDRVKLINRWFVDEAKDVVRKERGKAERKEEEEEEEEEELRNLTVNGVNMGKRRTEGGISKTEQ
ncbi:Hypothetical predicted protein [Octopus vulgaris]|uniref:Uncharacterized protein n=1 Tax=Octopus vulgaris TaxID=6645 RepID=A0AA36BAI1_OCTVU|nr:Hypothetical predicted protein [Octopus vulgaris]